MCSIPYHRTCTRRLSQRLFCSPLQRSRSQAFCRRNSVVYTTRPSLSNPFFAGGHNSLHPQLTRFDALRQESQAYHVPRTNRKSAPSVIRSICAPKAVSASLPASPSLLAHQAQPARYLPALASTTAKFDSLPGLLTCSVPSHPAPDTKSEIIMAPFDGQIGASAIDNKL